jgi:pimeloyl-ACP methyl ester carboxylesterase
VALDFLGTGRSERLDHWPDDWYPAAAEQVAALIAHLGVYRAHLMGTSGGAVAALWAGILYPNRVDTIVADSCVDIIPPEVLRANVAGREAADPGFWRAAHGDDWREVVAADSAMLLRLAERGGAFFGQRLSEVRAPVLFTASLADEMLPDAGVAACRMVRQIPSARAMLFPQGGHPLMWSRPQEFRRVAGEFLSAW